MNGCPRFYTGSFFKQIFYTDGIIDHSKSYRLRFSFFQTFFYLFLKLIAAKTFAVSVTLLHAELLTGIE